MGSDFAGLRDDRSIGKKHAIRKIGDAAGGEQLPGLAVPALGIVEALSLIEHVGLRAVRCAVRFACRRTLADVRDGKSYRAISEHAYSW
jgi:hypothetical protein